jgi:hypothetical protein
VECGHGTALSHYSETLIMKENESDRRPGMIQNDAKAIKSAAINAAKDVSVDPDLDQRHKKSNEDLDEGELARLGNDRNDLA